MPNETSEDFIEINFPFHYRGAHTAKQCNVPRINEVTYDTFFENFLRPNRPCIVTGTFWENWLASKKWVQNGKPALDYLRNNYGNNEVPVADCNKKYFNAQEKCTYNFCDYVDYWSDYIKNGYPATSPCLYLKDWHFTRLCSEDNVYRVLPYFASDWLNEYSTENDDVNDDYRFVYMGPKGSWTPFHADVFNSFSWSVNICGRKRWSLFPPGEERHLRDKYGKLVYDLKDPALQNEELFPLYGNLRPPYEVVQEAGEAIFIPSGWHHQVWNMEDTISINHNWVNGCNIETMWHSLQTNLLAVRREILDCKDMDGWEDHCQLMLRASFGIDYREFHKMLNYIARKRLVSLEEENDLVLFGNWKLGVNHKLFDLRQIKQVLKLFTMDRNACAFGELCERSEELADRIDRVTGRTNSQ